MRTVKGTPKNLVGAIENGLEVILGQKPSEKQVITMLEHVHERLAQDFSIVSMEFMHQKEADQASGVLAAFDHIFTKELREAILNSGSLDGEKKEGGVKVTLLKMVASVALLSSLVGCAKLTTPYPRECAWSYASHKVETRNVK